MTNGTEKNTISITRALLITLLAFAFALGVFADSAIGFLISPSDSKSGAVPESAEGTFRFIRTSAISNSSENNRSTKELKPFQYKVNDLIESTLK